MTTIDLLLVATLLLLLSSILGGIGDDREETSATDPGRTGIGDDSPKSTTARRSSNSEAVRRRMDYSAGALTDITTIIAAAEQPTSAPRESRRSLALQADEARSATARRRRRALRRLLLLGLGGVIIVAVLILIKGSLRTRDTSVPRTPTALVFRAAIGGRLSVQRVVGRGLLIAPAAAVFLPDGRLAVADTGHGRVVLFSGSGLLLTSIPIGAAPTSRPCALAVSGDRLLVLDSSGGSLLRFTLTGRPAGAVFRGAESRARDMALDDKGHVLVTNPATNSVDVWNLHGDRLGSFSSPSPSSAATGWDQPSAIAIGHDGQIYVVDNGNNRLKILDADGVFIGQRGVPSSTTAASARVLPLNDGRLVVSEPAAGALLLYPRGNGPPTRYTLPSPTPDARKSEPLGISGGRDGRVLVADARGNRVLVILLPHQDHKTRERV